MNIKDLTWDELDKHIDARVEKKIKELLSDPDAGLELRPEFVREVQESLSSVKKGGKTTALKQYAAERGITV